MLIFPMLIVCIIVFVLFEQAEANLFAEVRMVFHAFT